MLPPGRTKRLNVDAENCIGELSCRCIKIINDCVKGIQYHLVISMNKPLHMQINVKCITYTQCITLLCYVFIEVFFKHVALMQNAQRHYTPWSKWKWIIKWKLINATAHLLHLELHKQHCTHVGRRYHHLTPPTSYLYPELMILSSATSNVQATNTLCSILKCDAS